MAAELGTAELASLTVERIASLAGFSEEPGRLTRRFATPALVEATARVGAWMEEAGMTVSVDAIGNLRGRREGDPPGAPALILGSHLDTVRDAGSWDGTLGVLVALSVIRGLADQGRRLPFALELVAFADEEGTRYGTAYLGSSAFAGEFDFALLERRDEDGITMADAIAAAGGDPARITSAQRGTEDVLGYIEVHIEQGPALEDSELPVAVVEGIVGQTRVRVTYEGVAGHAGTVPADKRRDALCAAAELVLAVERRAIETAGLRATVGELRVEPGAANVIPGRTELSIDIRHLEDAERHKAVADLHEASRQIAAARGLDLDWESMLEQDAIACDQRLTSVLEEAIRSTGIPVQSLASGAGHDGAALASAMPIGMLFVRCTGGISHNSAEAVETADVAASIGVLEKFLELLAVRLETEARAA